MSAATALRPVIVLTGPTGSGKTRWALEFAARHPVEIVSVDSAQVYVGLDIGSAKPSVAERATVPHHLIDIRDPAGRYSAGDFVRDARTAITGIHARGRVPLLVGGTMLYLRALHRGMAALPEASPEIRAQLDAEAAAVGWVAMHAQLRALDPVAAARIHPNDPQRIQRALEVQRLTGRTLSSHQAETRGSAADYHWLRHALLPADRAAHAAALGARFAAMLRQGLAEEVRGLYARGDLGETLPAIRSVGYRQLWEWCASRMRFEQACLQAVIATRQLCKRQLTWLRSERDIESWDIGADDKFPKWEERILSQLGHG